jgi:hypothetical protein
MASVRARCDCAWRWRWKASAGVAARLAGLGFLARLALVVARRASACSSWRAFWKSPRHSRAVPSQASR